MSQHLRYKVLGHTNHSAGPYLWDQLGFPSLGTGPNDYFNRTDVQKALHVPKPTSYLVCSDDTLFPNGDESVPSALGPIPGVIERTNNVIIGHGYISPAYTIAPIHS